MTNTEQTDPQVQLESSPASEEWVTLREGSERAGVSVSTIRRWCRSEEISSRLETRSGGERRMVRIAEVLERSDFKKSNNREVEVVLLPAHQAPPPTAARQATVEIVPSVDNSSESAPKASAQLNDVLKQLASAEERAVRAELHYAFEIERRNALEERVARLEAFHRASPATNALFIEDRSRSRMDNPDPETDAATKNADDPRAESPPQEAPGVHSGKAIPHTQPTTAATPKEPPPPDAPDSPRVSERGYFDPEGTWIPITSNRRTKVATPKKPPPPDAPDSPLVSERGHFDPEGTWIPITNRDETVSEPPTPPREVVSAEDT